MKTATLAIFDFDGTMIQGDSIIRLISHGLKQGLISFPRLLGILWATLLYFIKLQSAERAKTRALAFLKPLSPEKREAFLKSFVQNELVPEIYPPALAKIQEHLQKEDTPVLVSASPDSYMRYLTEFIPVKAVLATPVNENVECERNVRGPEKVNRMRAWLKAEGLEADWPASSSYGNSASDLPLMLLCGHPVLVNPTPKAVKQAPQLPRVLWSKHDHNIRRIKP